MRIIARTLLMLFITAACLSTAIVQSWAKAFEEYEVKAGIIVQFIPYVQWPGEWDTAKLSQINLCIIGDDPFDKYHDTVFKAASKRIPLALNPVVLSSWREASNKCHIAFISNSEKDNITDIINGLSLLPVLTISDIEGFAEKGGNIGFVFDDKARTNWVINMQAATKAGLNFNPEVLGLKYTKKVIR